MFRGVSCGLAVAVLSAGAAAAQTSGEALVEVFEGACLAGWSDVGGADVGPYLVGLGMRKQPPRFEFTTQEDWRGGGYGVMFAPEVCSVEADAPPPLADVMRWLAPHVRGWTLGENDNGDPEWFKDEFGITVHPNTRALVLNYYGW